VAIVGRANVGKSTLFNRLARQRRALVEGRPGVTRDRIIAPARIEDRDVLLVDTGGLDPEAEAGIPAAVREQVQRAIEESAVILFLVDAREGLLPLDAQIAELLRRVERQVILVANKADAPRLDIEAAEFHALGFEELIPVSAEHKLGIADLEIAIAERLPAEGPPEAEDAALRVALVGRPNVGKSSMMNRLLGETATIVAEQPGTTRDAVDARLKVGDAEVVLVDTAGLRRAGRRRERLERGSAWMALRAVQRADVAVLLIDASEGVTEQDARIARLALDRGRPLVLALNKWDLIEPGERSREIERRLERRLGFVRDPVVLRVSAKTGAGVARLLPRVLELAANARRRVSTSELNRVLEEAVERNQPPLAGRRRPRFFYATQVSDRPFTVLVFVNDPELVPTHYQRYLVSFFRKRFGLRSGPIRVRLRARRNDGGGSSGERGASSAKR
jgi:GTP-binding protein